MNPENEKIEVSIVCAAFNHEKYIAQCLEGFVTQSTDFKFEAIVHDDCSSDSTPEIIREYAEKYPDIIKPVFEEENQKSKGVAITGDIIIPRSGGKYLAFCEGDDYWCDSKKLQRQYDYMEEHPECAMCVHNTLRHDLDGGQEDLKFNDWSDVHTMSEEDVFFGWNVHLSSYFIRKEYYDRPEYKKKYWFGDYVTLLHAYAQGTVVCLPYVMSVYNFNNHAGVTYQNKNNGYEILAKRTSLRRDFLLEFDEYTDHKYNDVISRRIEEIEFKTDKFWLEGLIGQNTCSKEEILKCARKLEDDPYLQGVLAQVHGLSKLKQLYRYHGYKYGYRVWRSLLKSRQKT